MTDFCNFSRYFFPISGPQIPPNFKTTFSLTNPSFLWSNHLVSTYCARKRPSKHRKITKTPIFTSFTGQKCRNPDSAVFIWQLRIEENREIGLRTRIKSPLEVLTGTQLVWGTLHIPRSQEKPSKSKKMEKTAFHEKNKDKTGHAISLPDALKMTNNTLPPKTLPTHINTHLICFPHQVWSHSAHKRPKNYQKTYFLPLRGHAKTPKYSHEWVHQIAHCTRTTGPIDYLSIWKVALPPK